MAQDNHEKQREAIKAKPTSYACSDRACNLMTGSISACVCVYVCATVPVDCVFSYVSYPS